MTNHLHISDLPDGLDLGPMVAIDCETMGLHPHRDRFVRCAAVQAVTGTPTLSKSNKDKPKPRTCAKCCTDPDVLKLFHFGRFDIAAMQNAFGAVTAPVYCTKIASRLIRTYTDRHGLKNLLQELLGVDISKQQQSSDWGADTLSKAQVEYAASDVLYLHRLREELNTRLVREGRMDVAQACFDFLPMRANLDLIGWPDTDIFAHS